MKETKYNELKDDTKDIIDSALNYYEMNNAKRNTITVKSFPVILKYCDPPAKFIDNQVVMLMGDSAYTAHFLSGQGINSGFREINWLVNNIILYKGYDRKYFCWLYRHEVNEERKRIWTPVIETIARDMKTNCDQYDKDLLINIAKINNLAKADKLSKNEICKIIYRQQPPNDPLPPRPLEDVNFRID